MPVSQDPICRERQRQLVAPEKGADRIKVPGLAHAVWLRQLAAALEATGATL